jgi:hypothetical protein
MLQGLQLSALPDVEPYPIRNPPRLRSRLRARESPPPAPLYVEAMEVDRYSLGARPRERARVASVQGEVKLELSEGTLRSRMTQGRVVHHLVLLPHLQKDSNDAKQTFRISHITRCAMGWH